MWIEQIRTELPEVKIIIYSVCNDEDIIFKYKTVFGVDAYLTKPYHTFEDVGRVIFDLLGTPYPL